MDISLRAVTAEDAEFLYAVYASTRADEMRLVDWTDSQKEAFLRMQFAAQSQSYTENYPGAQFQVILLRGKPAGRWYLHRRPRELRIMDIALLPEFRGQGIGTALLAGILAAAARDGLPVTIHVEQFNPAMRLYRRLGFRLLEDKGVYHLMQWAPPEMETDETA